MFRYVPTVLLLVLLLSCPARAGEVRISSTEPVVVSTPAEWQGSKVGPSREFPVETYRILPPSDRNATCLISILGRDRQEFTDAKFLKTILRGDCRPYVSSPGELSKVEIKELRISGGLGFYANFVDPDLVGKPVKKGDYKTATPIYISLGSKYLIKVTILCDEISGADYREAVRIVESLKLKQHEV